MTLKDRMLLKQAKLTAVKSKMVGAARAMAEKRAAAEEAKLRKQALFHGIVRALSAGSEKKAQEAAPWMGNAIAREKRKDARDWREFDAWRRANRLNRLSRGTGVTDTNKLPAPAPKPAPAPAPAPVKTAFWLGKGK